VIKAPVEPITPTIISNPRVLIIKISPKSSWSLSEGQDYRAQNLQMLSQGEDPAQKQRSSSCSDTTATKESHSRQSSKQSISIWNQHLGKHSGEKRTLNSLFSLLTCMRKQTAPIQSITQYLSKKHPSEANPILPPWK